MFKSKLNREPDISIVHTVPDDTVWILHDDRPQFRIFFPHTLRIETDKPARTLYAVSGPDISYYKLLHDGTEYISLPHAHMLDVVSYVRTQYMRKYMYPKSKTFAYTVQFLLSIKDSERHAQSLSIKAFFAKQRAEGKLNKNSLPHELRHLAYTGIRRWMHNWTSIPYIKYRIMKVWRKLLGEL